MNTFTITGRLGGDPVIRTTNNGKKVASFSVAENIGKDRAQWWKCSAFESRADFIERFFTKGKGIQLSGKLEQGQYTNKNGETVKTTTLIVFQADFVPETKQDRQTETSAHTSSAQEEDIPF